MGGYIANFTVYTMAMIGLICFAIFVYKKLTDGSMSNSKTKFLNIEDSMSLTPRKTLHVIRAGNEKFLIASDVDRTTLISKLENSSNRQNAQKILEKNLDRFKNIELETQNFPETKYEEEMEEIEHLYKTPQVHLELIKGQNPQVSKYKRGMDRNISTKVENKINTKTRSANSSIHNNPTMKEMAMKINEL